MRADLQGNIEPLRHVVIDRRLRASQQVYEDLRVRILSLELKPGEALSRVNLAESYGLSQTPVRDAFLQLQQEDLVDVYPQSRTVVTKIDVAQAREAQFLRLAIEVETIRTLALDPDKKKLAAAQQILSQQRLAFVERGDLSSFSLLDGSLHMSLCTAVGHPELWELVLRRSGHIDRLRRLHLPDPGKAATILAEHAEILQAILSSNAADAESALRKHLSGTLSEADQIRARYPEYF